MRWRSRVRKAAKWTGLAACVLMVVGFCVTLRWQLCATVCRSGVSLRGVILASGAVGYTCGVPAPTEPEGFTWVCFRNTIGLIRWPSARGTLQSGLFYLPLWIPFGLVLVPTVLLWRGDRIITNRVREGRCMRCGYDRRGLASDAPCPECGAMEGPLSSRAPPTRRPRA